MDLLIRCITSAFCLSHDIRRDVEVAIVMLGPGDPPKTIRFLGNELKYLNPDERSTGALIRNALVKYSAMKTKDLFFIDKDRNDGQKDSKCKSNTLTGEITSSPGIFISDNCFNEVLEHYSGRSTMICLHEAWADIHRGHEILTGDDEVTFILSDDKNFSSEEEHTIDKHSPLKLSLGPKVLHTDHCVILIHNYLDRKRN